MTPKFRDVVKIIEADGWYPVKRGGGSHRQYKHPTKPGKVTINGEPGDDVPLNLLKSILRQAGLEGKGPWK